MVGYTELSGASSVQMVNLFGKKTIQPTLNRTSSIFEHPNGNSLRITDLLSQLLHSKYEVLRSKRSLQLLQVRYDSEQRKMAQLRYTISRMQSEFIDLKNMANGAKQFVLNNYVSNENSKHASRSVSIAGDNVSERSRSQSHSFLDDDDTDFLQDALGDIMADMDIDLTSNNSSNKKKKVPKILRAFSSIKKNKLKEPRASFRRRSAVNYRSKRQRRNSAGHIKRGSSKQSALGVYNFNRKKNSNLLTDGLLKQIGNKHGLLKQSKSMRKELLNDMIFSTKKDLKMTDADDDEEELKKRQLINHQSDTYVPSVPFNDITKLWRGYDKEWIKKWQIEDVTKWLKSVHEGRLRKYTQSFRKARIDGKRLLDLQMPNLLHLGLTRDEATKILEFTNSIAIDDEDDDDDINFNGFFNDLDDFGEFFNDTDIDDFFEDDEDTKQQESDWSDHENEHHHHHQNQYDAPRASINVNVLDKLDHRFYDDPTMRLTDLMIEQLNKSEIMDMRKLRLLSVGSHQNAECINFSRLKVYYADEIGAKKQVLLATIFGLLCNKVGLLNICEWNDLLNASKSYKVSENAGRKSGYFDDHMVIINSFVDVYGIYSEHSDHDNGCLTIKGAKYFIASLRQSAEEAKNLRDDEDGVSFFAGLRIDEMEKFVMRLPTTIWTLINNPLEIELVYREIKTKCSQNVTSELLQNCLVELGASFVAPNMVESSMKEMNLSPNPTVLLDIWIKKLFIKTIGGNEESHASVSILDELLIINDELELAYYKEQRLELMARNSGDSQPNYDDADSLNVDTTLNEIDSDGDYDDDEQKEVVWVPNYLNLNKLLHDVGCFGTSGKCHGLNKIPKIQFSASSEANKKTANATKCKLNGKYGWTANHHGSKNQNVHWIQVDLGKITTVFAVAIQGKYEKDEWITKGVLTASNTYNQKSDEWKKVQLAGDNDGKIACTDNQTVQVYMLSRWIKARYIRLNIYKYHNAPSLRWDLCFGDVRIPNINDM